MVLDTPQDLRTVWVGDIKHEHSHGIAALAAQGAGKQVGTIAEFICNFPDPLASLFGDTLGRWPVVEHHRHGRDGNPALPSNVFDCYHRSPVCDNWPLRRSNPRTPGVPPTSDDRGESSLHLASPPGVIEIVKWELLLVLHVESILASPMPHSMCGFPCSVSQTDGCPYVV